MAFNVELTGKYLAGFTREDAISGLGKMFKKSKEDAAKILDRTPYVIKSCGSEEEANRYLKAMASIGLEASTGLEATQLEENKKDAVHSRDESPSKDESTETETEQTPPLLWNPNAAASWSVLFTPIFGALLHAKNWTALGEEGKAKKSMYWVYFSMLLAVANPFLPEAATAVWFWVLIIWYFSFARQQTKYVEENFNNDYEKLSWTKPLGAAVAIFISYIVVFSIVLVALGMV